jgi:hypothetical protein
VALRSKSEYWLAGNYDNVSEWSDVSKYGLLFQSVSTIKTGLLQSRHYHQQSLTHLPAELFVNTDKLVYKGH